MFDSWGRDIHYLRISVTDRCNLRCRYCMPAPGIDLKRHDQILSYENMARVAAAAAELGVWKVRLTGGEPLVRRGLSTLVRYLRRIPGIREIGLTTNGILLADHVRELKAAGLDRINVSLDSLDPERYRVITRGGDIRRVLDGIEAARAAGFQNTKINMVLLEDTTPAEVREINMFCRKRDLHLQRIHHYRLEDIHSVPQCNPAERPLPCNRCNRIRLTADGLLKPCLFSDRSVPLDFLDLESSVKRAILAKPAAGSACREMQNWQIGG